MTQQFTGTPAGKLFPTDLPDLEPVQFTAEGFSAPVSGVIHSSNNPAVNGMPLGGIDTGCLDLETNGLLGYCTIFKFACISVHAEHRNGGHGYDLSDAVIFNEDRRAICGRVANIGVDPHDLSRFLVQGDHVAL